MRSYYFVNGRLSKIEQGDRGFENARFALSSCIVAPWKKFQGKETFMPANVSWTETKRTALVLDILEGQLTAKEAAARHGLEPDECSSGGISIFAVCAARRQTGDRVPPGAGSQWPWRSARCGAARRHGLVSAQINCTSGLICFGDATPAKASEVNLNFKTLKDWIEQKVGSVGSVNITTTGTVTTGGSIANISADGALGVSADKAFRDTGDSWLRLNTSTSSGTYADLAVGKLWVNTMPA